MNDDELRAMVRDAIARLQSPDPAADATVAERAALGTHASQVRLALVAGGDPDGACLIEPSVRCTHCGYCQSYGH
jgi:hypothetical protein